LAQAEAITIKSQGANVQITLNLPYSQVEDPAIGDTVGGCTVAEWLDADYVSGAYKDWQNDGTGTPDGHPNEVWLRGSGMALKTTTTVPSTAVAIHLVGDNNDGLADVFVDGTSVALLDMQSPSPPAETALILVTGLSNTTHEIRVLDRGDDPESHFGQDVAILGASVCGEGPEELYPKWRQRPHPPDEGFNVPSWLDWLTMLNEVVADDFRSDGRPITHVRWWGSYIDPLFEPICGPTPDGLGCQPVPCPDPLQACVPVAVEYSQVTGLSRVVECECRDPGGCQVWFSGIPGEEPQCIGTCPPNEVCVQTIEDLGNGLLLFRCVCVPIGYGAMGPGDGACCFPGGGCDDTIDELACAQNGGTWFPGESCQTFQCPTVDIGACCVDGICIDDLPPEECFEHPLAQWYPGETCENFECPDFEIDGWLISFHTDLPADPPVQPYSQPEHLLGLYFAPAYAVTIEWTDNVSKDGHQVYRYFVSLAQCCLLHAEIDPRNDTFPAREGVFEETDGFIYWLDIQAVVGQIWELEECQGIETLQSAPYPFWGWHTSPDHWNDVSVTGHVVMPTINEWQYEAWVPVDGTPFQLEQVDQAFVLLTPEPPPFCAADITGPLGPGNPDGNVDALDFLLVIAQWGTAGPEADITGPGGTPDGIVDALDFLLVIAQWGSPANC
jgi:hypothetical protein